MRYAWTLVIVIAGCAHAPLVPRAWIGTANARQTSYLHLARFIEETPDAIQHDTILDEATLASFDGATACADLIERTAVGYDEPIDALAPLCRGGARQPAAVSNETVSVMDYDFTTQQVVARVHAVTPFGFAKLRLTEPTDVTFRVIERHARVCCPTGGGALVRIVIKSPRVRVNDVGASYGEEFAWQVQ